MQISKIRKRLSKRYDKPVHFTLIVGLFSYLFFVPIFTFNNRMQTEIENVEDMSQSIETQAIPKTLAATSTSSFRFIAWADTKTGTSIFTAESKIVNSLNPVFTIYPGDLCENGPDATCFTTWKNALNDGGTNTLFNKTFATRGNHDSAGSAYWQSVFNFASVASGIGARNYVAQASNMTYSFDYGNSHFIGIDLPAGAVTGISTAQITWLDSDLTAAEGRGLTHAFLFWHGPIYPVAEHCCSDKPSTALATVLAKHPIISATFHGHEHVIAYKHITSAIIPGLTKPFEEFISGDAGAGPGTMTSGRADGWLNSGDNWASSGSLNTGHGFISVDVNCNNYTVSVYNINGSVAKTFSFSNGTGCETNPTPTPTVTPRSPTPTRIRYVTPTIYCLGSCPTTIPTPLPAGASPSPTPITTTSSPSEVPTISPTTAPCVITTTAVSANSADNEASRNKQRNSRGFFQRIWESLIQLINRLLELLRLGVIPAQPTQPVTPTPTTQPNQSITPTLQPGTPTLPPCEPSPIVSIQPSSTILTNTPSSPTQISAPTPTTRPISLTPGQPAAPISTTPVSQTPSTAPVLTASPCVTSAPAVSANSADNEASRNNQKNPRGFFQRIWESLIQLINRLLELLGLGRTPINPAPPPTPIPTTLPSTQPVITLVPTDGDITPLPSTINPTPTPVICPTITPAITTTPAISIPATPTPAIIVTPTTPPVSASNVKWAGTRSSRYGISPFPSVAGWTTAITAISGYFPGSTPVVLWLPGEIEFNGNSSGQGFNFPNPGGPWNSTIKFASSDQNESYLTYFDTRNIKVFLQVEPGFSPIDQLFDIMYRKYSQHPSVIGFGVDVEWYQSSCDGCTNAKVTNSLAQTWESKIKTLNPNYNLFLKHYDKSNLPPAYRGSITFVDDSEQNGSYDDFLSEMKTFADFFYPNPVMYQIGYPSDKSWWQSQKTPIPQTIGKALSAQTKSGQNAGVVWVDFSLRDVLTAN